MPIVLLYNLPENKLKKIRFLLWKLGLDNRVVKPAEFGLPVGVLAERKDLSPAAAPQELPETPFSGEMLVMCSLSSPQFSAFLSALRQNRCPVALKAVLTEANASWSSQRLYRELSAEHEALQKVRPREAGAKSAHKDK